MNEIVSVPNSLKDQINHAQNLLAQSRQAEREGDSQLAVVRAKAGLRVLQEISQRNPELGALLVAAEHGYRGIEVKTVEHVRSYELVEQKFLGITTSTQVVPVTTSKETTRTIRLI